MQSRSRARWLALTWMLFALLSFPVAGWCQDDDEDTETETEADTAARHEREEEAGEKETAAAWEETHRGFYIQGQGSYGILATEHDAEKEAEDVANLAEPVSSTTDDAWGAGGRLGWRVNKNLAIEGQVEIFGKYEIDHDSAAGGEEQTDLRFLTGTLNVKGYLPMNRFQPYLLIGGGYANAKLDPPNGASDNRHGGAARFGVGADLYGNERVGVFTEAAYVLPFGDVDDFDQVSIGFGLILRFYGD